MENEIDKSCIYTAVNAKELKEGDKIICSDELGSLLPQVKAYYEGSKNVHVFKICEIRDNKNTDYVFDVGNIAFRWAYFVEHKEEIEYIPWTKENFPLHAGDCIVSKNHPDLLDNCEFSIISILKRSFSTRELLFDIYDSISGDFISLSFTDLFQYFVQKDGSPCGTLKETGEAIYIDEAKYNKLNKKD